MFIHQDPDWPDLLGIVARAAGQQVAMVEKDYWVTHTLWALYQQGFDIWFKGGTSLSKGFGLIQRFSEDLDLKVVPRELTDAPAVHWKGDKPQHIASRKAWYRRLSARLVVPGTDVVLDEASWSPEGLDPKARGVELLVHYPERHLAELGRHNVPSVKLELGDARVTPFVVAPVSSFIHDWLAARSALAQFTDNRPAAVRHVHPWVTLIEKLDAISRRYARTEFDPARFVRHYEDAARIVLADLPAPDGYTREALIDVVMAGRPLPTEDDPALVLADPRKRDELEAAYDALAAVEKIYRESGYDYHA